MTAAAKPMPQEPILLRDDAAGVATLTLNRPEARNALSVALLDALQAEFDAIAKDDSVRVVVVAKAYADRPPGRGELVAIRFKTHARPMVKRVIAIAGDAIELKDGQLWLNGRRLNEPYLAAPRKLSARAFRLLAVQLSRNDGVVPRGQLMVMGDNTGSSFDSGDYGFVSLRQVIGTVVPVLEPIE